MGERCAVQTLIEHAAQFLDAAFSSSQAEGKAASSLPRDSLLQATALLECAYSLSSAARAEDENDRAGCVSAALDICIRLLRLPQLLSSGSGSFCPSAITDGRPTTELAGDAAEPTTPDAAVTSTDTTTLQDIIGNEQAKRMLLDNVVLPLRAGPAFRKQILSGIRAGAGNVLLYGPPGNGKTKLARASANAANAKFFPVNPSNILSKYQGESERYVKQMFALAKKAAPAVIFFDEVDSVGCARGSAGDDVQHRRLLAELLIQFNSISADDKVVVLGATNRIEDVDEALLRRFHARICVGPPSQAARVALLKAFMTSVEHDLSTTQFEAIAHATEGWSGADIEVLCREAALGPVRALFTSGVPAKETSDLEPYGRRATTTEAAPSTSNVAEIKRPASEVTPPRDSYRGGRPDTAPRKKHRVDALHLGKELAKEHAVGEAVKGALSLRDDNAPAFSTTLLEELLNNDDAPSQWRIAPVMYKDFLTAYAAILSVDVAPQELADLITVPVA